jgi:glycerol-3-phosphate dehydrogenase
VYGVRALEVLALAAADPRLAKVLPGEDEPLAAEFVHAFTAERARTLTDALHRRTMVGLDRSVGLDTAEAAAEVCGQVLIWSDARVAEEIEAHRAYVHRFRPRALRSA